MRFLIVSAAILFGAGSLATSTGAEPPNDPTLHTERGKCVKIVIEETTHYQRPICMTDDGKFFVSGEIKYHRLIFDGILHGSQAVELDYNAFDMFQVLTVGNLWDNVATAGAIRAFDMRQVP